jgi:hypothetical protein
MGQPCCQEHELYYRLLEARCRFEYSANANAVYREWDGPRITREAKGEIDLQRLLILEKMERHLDECGELAVPRQQAITSA